MVPTLKVPNEGFKHNGFVNAFIKDLERDVQYEDVVYILFKPEKIDAFRLFLDSEYERTENIIEDYDYEGGFVVLVYKLNPNFKEDFALIKEGKYSKTSDDFKNLFPKAVKIKVNGWHRDEISLQWRIFRKSTDLREYWEDKLGVNFDEEQEVWGEYNEDIEILNIKNIKKMYVQPANT